MMEGGGTLFASGGLAVTFLLAALLGMLFPSKTPARRLTTKLTCPVLPGRGHSDYQKPRPAAPGQVERLVSWHRPLSVPLHS